MPSPDRAAESRRCRARNPEKVRAYKRDYRLRKPEIARAWNRRYRARLRWREECRRARVEALEAYTRSGGRFAQ